MGACVCACVWVVGWVGGWVVEGRGRGDGVYVPEPNEMGKRRQSGGYGGEGGGGGGEGRRRVLCALSATHIYMLTCALAYMPTRSHAQARPRQQAWRRRWAAAAAAAARLSSGWWRSGGGGWACTREATPRLSWRSYTGCCRWGVARMSGKAVQGGGGWRNALIDYIGNE